MANTIFFAHVLGLFTLMLLMQKGGATEFQVNWAPNSQSYNQWAEANRFQIGDSLVFNYPANKDVVLHVTKDDYDNCNTATPLESFTDGHTQFKLIQSGPYYFISGVKDNCQKNEKLVVIVLSDRGDRSAYGNQTDFAPPPPPSDMIPSPAPGSQESPSPPTSDIVPSSPPEGDNYQNSPPPNAASSVFMGVIGSFGGFLGSCLLLVF